VKQLAIVAQIFLNFTIFEEFILNFLKESQNCHPLIILKQASNQNLSQNELIKILETIILFLHSNCSELKV
jgi:hypothetical protein